MASWIATSAPRMAWAQVADSATTAAARGLAEEGLSQYDSGRYAAALDRFERADALIHAPTMGLMAARCLEKLGRLVESAERYLQVSRTTLGAGASKAQREALVAAAREREALVPRIPTLQIDLVGANVGDAVVTLDGREVPVPLISVKRPADPGHHRIEAVRGGQRVVQEMDLKEGAAGSVVLDMQTRPAPPAPAAAPPAQPPSAADPAPEQGNTQRTLGFVGLGVGAAALGFGVVTGVMVLGRRSDLDAGGCKDGVCPPRVSDDVGSYNTLRTLSTAGFVGGAAFALGGAALLWISPRSPSARSAAWEPWVGPASAGVRGAF